MSHLSEPMFQWLNGLPTNKLSNLGEIFRRTRIAKVILIAIRQNPMITKLTDQLFKNIPSANLIEKLKKDLDGFFSKRKMHQYIRMISKFNPNDLASVERTIDALMDKKLEQEILEIPVLSPMETTRRKIEEWKRMDGEKEEAKIRKEEENKKIRRKTLINYEMIFLNK